MREGAPESSSGRGRVSLAGCAPEEASMHMACTNTFWHSLPQAAGHATAQCMVCVRHGQQASASCSSQILHPTNVLQTGCRLMSGELLSNWQAMQAMHMHHHIVAMQSSAAMK
eukprot:GHRQ01020746.1.p3 GENE.GHRQ01020746.1~~GHRQ01020746.1.p3  ORF type:complete len:113 (+),score=8.82 GHRQ01020746.1:304-642(+)